MTGVMSRSIKSVAIIGAGPSGLAAAKYLSAENSFFKMVIYEQRDAVDGVWNYTILFFNRHEFAKEGQMDQNPKSGAVDVMTAGLPEFNTPMYEGLETNLPHMLMQFSDSPFPEGTQLFPKRETVMRCLEDYASEVIEMIMFSHRVIDVASTGDGEYHGWTVTTTADSDEIKITAITFDANAKEFEKQRVLLVGGGPSAADIGQQIDAVCKHPLIIAQIEKFSYHIDQLYIVENSTLVAVNPYDRSARFQDESVEHDIDLIILCTGYAYTFPFLKPIAPTIEIQALPLYQHIFHEQHPTLAHRR